MAASNVLDYRPPDRTRATELTYVSLVLSAMSLPSAWLLGRWAVGFGPIVVVATVSGLGLVSLALAIAALRATGGQRKVVCPIAALLAAVALVIAGPLIPRLDTPLYRHKPIVVWCQPGLCEGTERELYYRVAASEACRSPAFGTVNPSNGSEACVRIGVLTPNAWWLRIDPDGSGQWGRSATTLGSFPAGTLAFNDILADVRRQLRPDGDTRIACSVALICSGTAPVPMQYLQDTSFVRRLFDKGFRGGRR